MFLVLLHFDIVSCTHNMSTFLLSIIYASSLPLPVIDSTVRKSALYSKVLLFTFLFVSLLLLL